ncbi:MAG TPA: hypothetical protein VGF59_35020 [Bryobacteraceae bacterium]|jgi:hypothetical protein
MKRTTLILADRRLADLKRLAAERGQTLSAVVDEFLAEGIRRAAAPRHKKARIPVYNMGEARVNIADRNELWDFMERE